MNRPNTTPRDRETQRATVQTWIRALDRLVIEDGPRAAASVLANLRRRAAVLGVAEPPRQPLPYVNTIAPGDRPSPAGDPELEQRIENLVRWNAMAMVVRANRAHPGLGGHIATYASAATLFEVGFNHVFRGPEHPAGSDLVFYQGHATPGVYARAYLEGRLEESHLDAFRREVEPGGLSSYPHPWLMPELWQVPSVSMGLAPIMAVYAARHGRYLQARGLVDAPGRVWALLGDGEMDEPEARGALALAGREPLDNLGFVINCNLQRLDGPVRGNAKIVVELEELFTAAGWAVIKVLWGGAWERLLADDHDGRLVARLDDIADGDLQRWAAADGATIRSELFGDDVRLRAMVEDFTDEALVRLLRDERGGHDRREVHAAYARAQTLDRPVVILAQTVKGWGLGDAGEAANVAHKAKLLDEDALAAFRDRLGVPVPDDRLSDVPYVRPDDDSPERRHIVQCREALGGFVPQRRPRSNPIHVPGRDALSSFHAGADRPATTTMVAVRIVTALLRDETLGSLIVPIVPDEARTFGMEALFPRVGIYDPEGAAFETVDAETLTPYRLSETGQLIEAGITEAGATCHAIAAGTSYANHGVPTIPFYFFYSMFGFQRVGDLLWAAGDARCRGFLFGATSGRTTLNGEGLQHQDGHSHLLALSHPHVHAYDPAYGYEVSTLIEHGLSALLEHEDDCLYYLTLTNEAGPQPPRPDGVEEGIVRGMYRLCAAESKAEDRIRLLASGPLVACALEARKRLVDDFDLDAEVYSVTSWTELHRDAVAAERAQRLDTDRDRTAWVRQCLGETSDATVPATVAVTDYVKALPSTVAPFIDGEVVVLGTDGFGRSDLRSTLRAFFEVDADSIVHAALVASARAGHRPWSEVAKAAERLGTRSRASERSTEP